MKRQLVLPLIQVYKFYLKVTHLIAKISGKYYFEDFLRVYPDGITFYPFGIKRKASKAMVNNFLNQSKFYIFASQVVKGKIVADVGCGSGFGVPIIRKAGAKKIFACDVSKHTIDFAKKRYANLADFTEQDIINLDKYPDNFFDVTVCSEVLEHIAEYGEEKKALQELKRITKKGGIIFVSTPNSEIMEEHGFSFSIINKLFGMVFKQYLVFENAFIPVDKGKRFWDRRLKQKKVGVIVSETIREDELAVQDGEKYELKKGLKPGKYKFRNFNLNTKLLHNTHSWVIVAKKS